MEAAAAEHGEGWRIPPATVEMVGASCPQPGVDPEHVDAVLARRGPHPIGTYARSWTPSPARCADLLSCTDKAAGTQLLAQAATLRAAGWTVHDIPTGHFPMLSMPDALTALLR